MGNNSVWVDEECKSLKQHWAAGKTATEIAMALAKEFKRPFSRNGVIGKAHRLGLTSRESPIKRKEDKMAAVPIYLEQPATIIPDDKHCHFVTGEDDKKVYCGRKATNKAYCEEHHEKMFVPVDVAKKRSNPFS